MLPVNIHNNKHNHPQQNVPTLVNAILNGHLFQLDNSIAMLCFSQRTWATLDQSSFQFLRGIKWKHHQWPTHCLFTFLKLRIYFVCPTRQDKMAILGKISPIFRLFSAYGTPSAHMFTDYAYFRLFFAYFPPVVPHPYYKLKHMLPICHFSAHRLRILLIFHLFSAYFPPKILPIFRPSCLAGKGMPHFCATTASLTQSSQQNQAICALADLQGPNQLKPDKSFSFGNFLTDSTIDKSGLLLSLLTTKPAKMTAMSWQSLPWIKENHESDMPYCEVGQH